MIEKKWMRFDPVQHFTQDEIEQRQHELGPEATEAEAIMSLEDELEERRNNDQFGVGA